ncbi:ABC transporter permease [Streptomyces nitrosporeus]|uniref:ABC transporter permease n=1 Tax=Streptomyces nitrosporeus TaxID=28894 RepID=UPI00332ED347
MPAGRHAPGELWARRGEAGEGAALGLPGRDARVGAIRTAASDVLLPGPDRTRIVGPVTLPGVSTGMPLGGASPVEAGAVRLFALVVVWVVAALLAAGADGSGCCTGSGPAGARGAGPPAAGGGGPPGGGGGGGGPRPAAPAPTRSRGRVRSPGERPEDARRARRTAPGPS